MIKSFQSFLSLTRRSTTTANPSSKRYLKTEETQTSRDSGGDLQHIFNNNLA